MIKPYTALVDFIRTNENRSSMQDDMPVKKAAQVLENIAQQRVRHFKNKDYLALTHDKYEKARADLVVAVKVTENSAHSKIASQYKKIHNALEAMFYNEKTDLADEIASIPQFEKFKDILPPCIQKVIEAKKELHKQRPQMGLPGSKNTIPAKSERPRKILEAESTEDDFTILDTSTTYTSILLNACQGYLNANRYKVSNHKKLAQKIIDYFADPIIANASTIMREVASQHILFALHKVLEQKSETFLRLIRESFNYAQEQPKFDKSLYLLMDITANLSVSDTKFSLDMNNLIYFIEEHYPQKISEVLPIFPLSEVAKSAFNSAIHFLFGYAQKIKDWEYLRKLGIHLCSHTNNSGSFEVWMAARLSEGVERHNYDAAVFKDIFEMVKDLHITQRFLLKLIKYNGCMPVDFFLPCKPQYLPFFHALAEAEVHNYIDTKEVFGKLCLDEINEKLGQYASELGDLKLMIQVFKNVEAKKRIIRVF